MTTAGQLSERQLLEKQRAAIRIRTTATRSAETPFAALSKECLIHVSLPK